MRANVLLPDHKSHVKPVPIYPKGIVIQGFGFTTSGS